MIPKFASARITELHNFDISIVLDFSSFLLVNMHNVSPTSIEFTPRKGVGEESIPAENRFRLLIRMCVASGNSIVGYFKQRIGGRRRFS
jgi:hypothetical protein